MIPGFLFGNGGGFMGRSLYEEALLGLRAHVRVILIVLLVCPRLEWAAEPPSYFYAFHTPMMRFCTRLLAVSALLATPLAIAVR